LQSFIKRGADTEHEIPSFIRSNYLCWPKQQKLSLSLTYCYLVLRMRKTALARIIVVLLASTIGVAYYVSVNQSSQDGTSNFNPTASATPTASPSPSQSPSLISWSTASASFHLFRSTFVIASPTNRTYNSDILTLNVTGLAMRAGNIELFMNYSLDGQNCVPIPVVFQARGPDDQYMGVITGLVALPKLSDGSHSITVFGKLEVSGRPDLAQATVYFTVQGS
jgi:hypothetical protein